ncbi:hypothetical protein INT44_001827 [Umbelopsis vinacea]|uniref:ADF-H domain-containing protein n=1 Tax=Umbelopsis vinacea TaxID=44442 RepID=A0A8H7UGS9_9FUNG|nr:hypothetical protein INT44_001827 [Umbelopsis vinacea]
MSCNLQDPKILEAYSEIIDYEPTDWLILGYNDTRDVISLYNKGTNGLRDHLREEVLFGFLRLDDRFILITYISEQVSGVRRARALVHGRAVATMMPVHNAQMTATMPSELSDTNINTKLKVGENRVPGKSNSRPQSMSKRNSMRIQSGSAGFIPSSPVPSENAQPSPESGISEEPEIIEHEDAAQAEERYQEELRQQQEERERREQLLEEERIRHEQEEAERRAFALAEEQKRQELEEQERRAAQEEAQRRAREEEAKRAQEALKRQLEEAERNGNTLLTGYVSVLNEHCPFWKRRYFTIGSSNMLLYRDEGDQRNAQVLPLSPQTTEIRHLIGDHDISIPNAVEVRIQNSNYHMFVESKQEADLLLTALKKAAGIAF